MEPPHWEGGNGPPSMSPAPLTRVLQGCPMSPALSTLSLGICPRVPLSSILETQRLRPTEETQVTNSSLLPFPDKGPPACSILFLASPSPSKIPVLYRAPAAHLLSICMLLTASLNHSVRSVTYEAEGEWELPFQAPGLGQHTGLEPSFSQLQSQHPAPVLHTGSNPSLLSPIHIHYHLWCRLGSGCHSHRTVPLLASPN